MAFDADISSELIIDYLILRSHPACASLKFAPHTPPPHAPPHRVTCRFPVPECVVDALHLWEKERHRLVFTPCSLFRFAASHRLGTARRFTFQTPLFLTYSCGRKDFESTRTFAKGLDAVLIDQDRRLQLAVKQDMCQRVLAFAQGLGSDQTAPAFHAL